MAFRAECLSALAALVLAGCATAPAGSLERAQEDWLREATALVHPHVERITGVKLPGVRVEFYKHSARACASAGTNARGFYSIRYYKSCEQWRFRGYGWLVAVAHELVHVADYVKHPGGVSKQTGKGRYGRPGSGHGPWWTRQYEAVMQQARGQGGWAYQVTAELPPWPCDKRECCTWGTDWPAESWWAGGGEMTIHNVIVDYLAANICNVATEAGARRR